MFLYHKAGLNKILMKRLLVLLALGFVSVSCGSKNRGELLGVKQKKWFGEKPYGMVLVEGGAYIMGKADEDLAQLQNAPAKTVTVPSFYMDETEITNSEYRQFIYWVKDSTALAMLARKADELELGEDNKDGIGEFAFKDADTTKLNEFQKYMRENYYDVSEDLYAGRALNWDADLSWDTDDYVDKNYAEVMDSLYLPPELWYNGEIKLDVSKLVYAYTCLMQKRQRQNPEERENNLLTARLSSKRKRFRYILTRPFGLKILPIPTTSRCITITFHTQLIKIIL